MHQALYRKYRPSVFTDVMGQEHITSVLQYEVANARTSHAYLFCGSRGTGKTTCAKILAKAVNCLSPVNGNPCGCCENCIAIEKGVTTDVLEMDAASNTGVDYIRDIKDAVMYAPSMLKTRVYIIDEVHMLSDGAFNALLKTLEEPPANVVFILATTEMQKIPSTILSRCQRFEFHRIAGSVISERLLSIAHKENIRLEEDAAHLIARSAQGGMRDAISLLELCSADGNDVTREQVERLSGGSSRGVVEKTVKAILDKNQTLLFEIVADLFSSSGDLSGFWQQLISYYRDMLVFKTVKNISENEFRRDILDLTLNEFQVLKELSSQFSYETLLYHSSLLDQTFYNISSKSGFSGRIAAEICLLRMSFDVTDTSPEALLKRISDLEGQMLKWNSHQMLASDEKTIKKETQKKQKEVSSTIKTDVEQKPTAQIQESKTKKYYPDFVEILHAYMKSEPSAAGFLSDAKAYISDDQTVTVYLSSSFSKNMLQAKKAEEQLSLLLTNQRGQASEVIFEVKNSAVDAENDLLNELT